MVARSLNCPNCGGRTRIQHGEVGALCAHCGSRVTAAVAVMEEKAQAWAFPPATPLRLGVKARYADREYEATGRVVMRQTDEEGTVHQWEEFTLVAPDGHLLYLEFDEGKWKISEPFVPTTPLGPNELQSLPTGNPVSLDGKTALVSDRGVAKVAYVEGEFPWLVTAGQEKGFLDATAFGTFYSVEWTQDAVEYYRGRFLDERQVYSIFGQQHLLVALDRRDMLLRSRRGFGAICIVTAVVAFILWGAALSSGSVVTKAMGTAPISRLGAEGMRFGPFALNAANRVHRLEIFGQMREQSNWVQAVLEDEQEQELVGADRDMWDESGTDSDGAWHESDLHASTDFVVTKPGNYYVRVYGEPDAGRTASGDATASFTLKEKAMYPLWPLLFAFLSLIVGAIALCAGSPSAMSKVQQSMTTGND